MDRASLPLRKVSFFNLLLFDKLVLLYSFSVQMATPIPSLFSANQSSSPWSFPSSQDSPHKTGARIDHLPNSRNTEQSSTESQRQNSVYAGSTPLSMPGRQTQGRASLSIDSSRSLSSDTGREAKIPSVSSSHPGWNTTPINAPYGVIGSSINTPSVHPIRSEAQPGMPIHRQSVSTSTPNIRAAVPARDSALQLPVAPLSAPPFQTSFFPLFGPPGTRQGFIMPGDWAINTSGFLISENARRLSAMALEVDKAELLRRANSERPRGPAAGCRMCAMVPRVLLFPCEHSVCSECGSRFMTASGGMYCSCGEVRALYGSFTMQLC